MTRQSGITLVEVLVAIFITGVGLLALLVLFPLGASEMAQSVRDDRTGHLKESAAAVANIWDIRNDPRVREAMLASVPPWSSNATPPGLPPPNSVGPSYAVLVDPIGVNSFPATGNNPRDWVAGVPGLMPRVAPAFLDPALPTNPDIAFRTNTPGFYRRNQVFKWMALLDDMTFPIDNPAIPIGTPGRANNTEVERGSRFTAAYVCRMNSVSAPTVVDLTVLVFAGRPFEINSNVVPTGEAVFDGQFDQQRNVITMTWNAGQEAPEVQPGNWVLDATLLPEPHGYFYRAVNVTQISATSLEVEVDRPLRGAFLPGGAGRIVVLNNLIEVFERGTF